MPKPKNKSRNKHASAAASSPRTKATKAPASPSSSAKASASPSSSASADARARARLEERLEALDQDNAALRLMLLSKDREIAGLLTPTPTTRDGTWQRGILPGGRYIKTDLQTGSFVVIDKQEWDALG
jgi:hypothetical protein